MATQPQEFVWRHTSRFAKPYQVVVAKRPRARTQAFVAGLDRSVRKFADDRNISSGDV